MLAMFVYNRKQQKSRFSPDSSHVFCVIVQMELRGGSKKGNGEGWGGQTPVEGRGLKRLKVLRVIMGNGSELPVDGQANLQPVSVSGSAGVLGHRRHRTIKCILAKCRCRCH